MNPGDRAGQWPFRYTSHAVAVQLPEKSSVWYRMFHHRFRTITGYWRQTGDARDHTGMFRNQNVSKEYLTPKHEHALTRSDLVLFYEGALDYALAHLDDVVNLLERLRIEKDNYRRSAEQHADESRNLRVALIRRDEEIETLRWTLEQVAKANRPDPILEQW